MKAHTNRYAAPKPPTPPATPVSEPDRHWRGLPLESGEAQPRPPAPRLH